MSNWFSKQLGSVKKIVTDPKKWAENAGRTLGQGAQIAAPFLPPGFRELASMGGSIAAGENKMHHLKAGVGAYIGSRMGGAEIGKMIASGPLKSAGINLAKQKLGMPVAAATAAGIPAAPGPPDVIETDTRYNPDGSIASQTEMPERGLPDSLRPMNTTGAPESGGGGWMDMLRKGGSWLKDHPDLLLAGGTALMGAKGSADASRDRDRAMAALESDYTSRAPLRQLGMSQLTTEDPRLASLGKIFRNGRPYEVAR